jgi:hypothetical protein
VRQVSGAGRVHVPHPGHAGPQPGRWRWLLRHASVVGAAGGFQVKEWLS